MFGMSGFNKKPDLIYPADSKRACLVRMMSGRLNIPGFLVGVSPLESICLPVRRARTPPRHGPALPT